MYKNIILFLSAVCVAFSVSCNKDDTEEKLRAEEQALANYMASNYPDVPLTDGFYFQSNNPVEGAQPKAGGYVLIDIKAWRVDTGTGAEVLERSSNPDDSFLSPVMLSAYAEGGPELWSLDVGTLYGWYAAIGRFHENESATFHIPSRYVNGDYITRKYEITLRKVFDSDAELLAHRNEIAGRYLTNMYGEDNIDTAAVTSGGIKHEVLYHIADKGTGASLAEQTVYSLPAHVKFSHLLMDEYAKNFAEAMETAVSLEDPVFSDILKNMNKGGRVVIAVPSELILGIDLNTGLPAPIRTDEGQQIVPVKSVALLDMTVDN